MIHCQFRVSVASNQKNSNSDFEFRLLTIECVVASRLRVVEIGRYGLPVSNTHNERNYRSWVAEMGNRNTLSFNCLAHCHAPWPTHPTRPSDRVGKSRVGWLGGVGLVGRVGSARELNGNGPRNRNSGCFGFQFQLLIIESRWHYECSKLKV